MRHFLTLAFFALTVAALAPAQNYGSRVAYGFGVYAQNLSFPFTFPDGTTTSKIYIGSQGRVTAQAPANQQLAYSAVDFLGGSASLNPYWNDITLNSNPGGGIFFHDRGSMATITWKNAGFSVSQYNFSFQLQLFPDGSFRYLYDNRIPVGSITFTGHSSGNGAKDPGGSNLSAQPNSGSNPTMYEYFFIFTNFDLNRRAVTFTPNGQGGYSVKNEASASLTTVPVVVPAAPDILNYQFNEFRGIEVANTATSSTLPAVGTVSRANWQVDPNRPGYRGNEVGFGALSHAPSTTPNYVGTNAAFQHRGSMTVSWWQRTGPGVGNGLAYAFGGPGVGSYWCCYTGGLAASNMAYRGRWAGYSRTLFSTGSVSQVPGQWQHICLVIDDLAGEARWYFDGASAGTDSIGVGTHSTPLLSELRVGSHKTSSYTYGTRFDMDDFRIYGRALSSAEVVYEARTGRERASASATGSTCNTLAGTPEIAGVGGLPTTGNKGFGIEFSNLETGAPTMIVMGLFPAAAPIVDLDPYLTGPGCRLQIDVVALVAGVPTNGKLMAALPIQAGFGGIHIYAQGVQLGSTTGGVTRVLDVNVQDN